MNSSLYRRCCSGVTDVSGGVLWLLLGLYFIAAAVVFFVWGIPSLEGRIVPQLFADSQTYEAAARALGSDNELIAVAGNYLGPTVILTVFDFNRIAIFLFNFALIICGVLAAVKNLRLSRLGVVVFVLSSPLLFFSLFGVNKEVFLLPLVVALLCYVRQLGFRWFIWAVLLSVFVRWQMTLFVFMIGILSMPPFRQLPRLWLVIGLLMVITLAYPPLSSTVLGEVEAISIEGAAEEQGGSAGGTYPAMQEIQRTYGYFLVALPKTLQLLVGYINRFSTENLMEDFWNSVVIMSQCFHNLILIILVLLTRRRLKTFDEFPYMICMVGGFFAVTPVFTPRYMLPISILMGLWLADIHQYSVDKRRKLNG